MNLIQSLLIISSGTGRTGVFIALSNLIDQIITEGVVNVYQTAKKMRQQRSSKILTRVRIALQDLIISIMATRWKQNFYKKKLFFVYFLFFYSSTYFFFLNLFTPKF